jgi:hypothetical protein
MREPAIEKGSKRRAIVCGAAGVAGETLLRDFATPAVEIWRSFVNQ